MVETASEEDCYLLKQLLTEELKEISGSIEIWQGDDRRCVRRIVFEHAYLCEHKEEMTVYSWLPAITTVAISPFRLDIDDLRLDRRFPKTRGHWTKFEEEKRGKSPAEKKPNIIDGYWSDTNNKRITKVKVGETVRFHISTVAILNGNKVDIEVLNKEYLKPIMLIGRHQTMVKDDGGYIEFEVLGGIKAREIKLYCKCKYEAITKYFPASKDDYLEIWEDGETITVIIELPHSEDTGLVAKGLGRHAGIIIGEEFFDFGPQGSVYKSQGKPWWDLINGDLTKHSIIRAC